LVRLWGRIEISDGMASIISLLYYNNATLDLGNTRVPVVAEDVISR
jgi:hypothetical protein